MPAVTSKNEGIAAEHIVGQFDQRGSIIIVVGKCDGRARKVHEGFHDIEAAFIGDCLQELVSEEVHLDDLAGGF